MQEAGITTAMITGDHKDTAVAIARELGLYQETAQRSQHTTLTSSRTSNWPRVESVLVYARVSAEHKLRIVQAWKRRGAIVAMTAMGSTMRRQSKRRTSEWRWALRGQMSPRKPRTWS